MTALVDHVREMLGRHARASLQIVVLCNRNGSYCIRQCGHHPRNHSTHSQLDVREPWRSSVPTMSLRYE